MKTLENTSEYKRNLNGSITCTFDHPSLGIIPNGLNPELDAELIVEIEAAGLIEEPTQSDKDAYEAEQIRTGLVTQLTALDVSQRTLEDALLGDEFALAKLQEAAVLKAEIRKGL